MRGQLLGFVGVMGAPRPRALGESSMSSSLPPLLFLQFFSAALLSLTARGTYTFVMTRPSLASEAP